MLSLLPFYGLLLLLIPTPGCDGFVLPQQRQQQLLSTSAADVVVQTFNTNKNRRHNNVLYMGWGPEPIWSSAKLISNEVACKSETCVSLRLELEDVESAKEYTIPGQYIQLRLNEETKPLFLAISSAPPSKKEDDDSNNEFEFLVKKTDGNEWLTSATVGDAMEISQVLGNGFPMADEFDSFKYDFPTQNVMLFACGSGIAPIKAAMESGLLQTGRSGGRTARLYYGVRSPEDLCFVRDFSKWEASGIEVVPVLSQPPETWPGRSGYVQNALEEDGVIMPRNSGALLCGMKGMSESVKDLLTKSGTFEGRILTNF